MSFLKFSNPVNSILYIGFNQDHKCFSCGLLNGFRVYSTDPLKERFTRNTKGGIGFVEMLYQCNILALVGGGPDPQYPPNKVMIWDDHQNACIGELTFRTEVKAVKLRKDKIVVILAFKVFIYDFSHLKLIGNIETGENYRALCNLLPIASKCILVCPGIQTGYLRLEQYDVRRSTLIHAHQSKVQICTLSFDGKLLATASEKGSIIRGVYCVMSGYGANTWCLWQQEQQ